VDSYVSRAPFLTNIVPTHEEFLDGHMRQFNLAIREPLRTILCVCPNHVLSHICREIVQVLGLLSIEPTIRLKRVYSPFPRIVLVAASKISINW
jgi:hypothetical protein